MYLLHMCFAALINIIVDKLITKVELMIKKISDFGLVISRPWNYAQG
ncbi:MAG: hypothetical protein K0R06_1044 [Clostridium sp.]|jgi:hypothetical protein|nr:hypothetical protein [Clostridium sp.]